MLQQFETAAAVAATTNRTRTGKRALDLAGVVFGLVVLAPLAAVVALAIRFDSEGPVFFRQQRIGRGGVPFTMYKFRTMQTGADSEVHRRYVQSLIRDGGSDELKGSTGAFKLDGDARITRVGAWLRRTSLDELPQLLNVLKGDMSLVGPRPPLAYEVELYSPRHARRLHATPGMTGLWQVSGRNDTDFEQMVDLDLEYVDRQCMWLDLSILARTFGVVASRNGF